MIGPAETLFLYFHAIHHGELPNSPSFSKREWEVSGSHPILPILQLCALVLCFSRSLQCYSVPMEVLEVW